MMILPRQDCSNCERVATVEMNGRPYCSEHALDKLRKTENIPNRMKLVSPR